MILANFEYFKTMKKDSEFSESKEMLNCQFCMDLVLISGLESVLEGKRWKGSKIFMF